MKEETFKSIEDIIFMLRNEIVKLKLDRQITDAEREEKITSLRTDIANKERLQMALIYRDVKQNPKRVSFTPKF